MDFLVFKPQFSRRLSRIFFSASSGLSRNFRGRLSTNRGRLSRRLIKLHRAGYSHKVNFDDLIKPAEKKLLCKVKNNECHVLRPLFPPLAQRSHSLRPRAHDFSKAFDTVRHHELAKKLAKLAIPDNIYNWLIDNLLDRKHATKFYGLISKIAEINASVVQGSGVGPSEFDVCASDLHPHHKENLCQIHR